MVTVVRAEALISAKNSLRPGLQAALRDLERFGSQSERAAARAAAAAARQQEREITRRRAIMVGAGVAAGYAALQAAQAGKEARARFADLDRQMTRIGITGDASAEEVAAGLKTMRGLALEVAAPVDQLRAGMEALTSSGLSFRESLAMLPSVAKTAQASGAAFDDIANSSLAATRHLKIAVDDLQRAQDMMVQGGQLGQFELKDMARYLPSLAPAAKAVGIEGTRGLARLVGMLQLVREGVGTSEEAATAFSDVLGKMESQETTNKFKKMGVDLAAGMAKARKEGRDLFETFIGLTKQALKGDMSKLPQLFQDKEMRKGMMALLNSWDRLDGLVKQIEDSKGAVDKNLKRVTSDTQASLDRLSESADRAKVAFGDLFAIVTAPAVKRSADLMQGIAKALEDGANTAKNEGASKGVATAYDGLMAGPLAMVSPVADRAELLAHARRARGLDQDIAAADREMEQLSGVPQTIPVQRRMEFLRRLRAQKMTEKELRPSEVAALGRRAIEEGTRPVAAFSGIDPAIDALREAAREAQRAKAFSGLPGASAGASQKKASHPSPPPHPFRGQVVNLPEVMGLDDAKSGANAVAREVSAIGPAAETAAQTMERAFAESLARIKSDVDQIARRLGSLRAPSLSFGSGAGGLPVGRAMPEIGQ